MANNLIQIKRSLVTATPGSLANGELAYTANGDHLFIGSAGSVVAIGGKQNPGVLTANQALVANATGYIDAVKTANLTVRSITANGVYSPGAGYLLSVDSGGNTYWLPQSSVSINTAAQFSWSNTHTFTANVSVDDTVIANNLSVDGNFTSNSSQSVFQQDAYFNANASFGSDTADSVTFVARIGSSLVPSANLSYSLGTTGLRWTDVYSSNVYATNISATDLTLSGNLTVSGTLTTISTTNLTVQDPLIKLANGNSSTDSLDIGLYGVYGSTGAKYTGLFRDATDGVYKLFKGVGSEPTTTVDTSDAGYSVATLQAYLNSGALSTNSTSVAITANSTVNVAIVANNLSWSGLAQNGIIYGGASGAFTSLSAGAGGTVLMVSTSGVPEFATLDGGTF